MKYLSKSLPLILPFFLLACNAKEATQTKPVAPVIEQVKNPQGKTLAEQYPETFGGSTQPNKADPNVHSDTSKMGEVLFGKLPLSSEDKTQLASLIQEQFSITNNGKIYLSPVDGEKQEPMIGDTFIHQSKTLDLNSDGLQEVLLTIENSSYGGQGGVSFFIFAKEQSTHKFSTVLDAPIGFYKILNTSHSAYKDIFLGGAGNCSSIWTWKNGKYEHSKSTCK